MNFQIDPNFRENVEKWQNFMSGNAYKFNRKSSKLYKNMMSYALQWQIEKSGKEVMVMSSIKDKMSPVDSIEASKQERDYDSSHFLHIICSLLVVGP